MRVMRAGSF